MGELVRQKAARVFCPFCGLEAEYMPPVARCVGCRKKFQVFWAGLDAATIRMGRAAELALAQFGAWGAKLVSDVNCAMEWREKEVGKDE